MSEHSVTSLPDNYQPGSSEALAHPLHYRPGTILPKTKVNWVYTGGGMGDFIAWTQAMRYSLTYNTHIQVRVFAPAYFIELARYWLSEFDNCEVHLREQFKKYHLKDAVLVAPKRMPLNATGHHLIDCGFAYYACREAPSEWRHYPQIDTTQPPMKLMRQCTEDFTNNYVVITAGATDPIRSMTTEAINEVAKYVKHKLRWVPVFIGKSRLTETHVAEFDSGVKYSRGVDLREKTSLLEAAHLMAYSKAVVGLDNGLLHLAGCTSANILMGFTNVDPSTRVPIRPNGKTLTLTPPGTLTCRFCTTNMRWFPRLENSTQFSFKQCLYKDMKCRETLTPELWCEGLEELTN